MAGNIKDMDVPLSTDTITFRKMVDDRFRASVEKQEKFDDKRKKDLIIIVCTIIGTIIVGLSLFGAFFSHYLGLHFKPMNNRLDKIEKRLETVEIRVKSPIELGSIAKTVAEHEVAEHEVHYHDRRKDYGKD